METFSTHPLFLREQEVGISMAITGVRGTGLSSEASKWRSLDFVTMA